MKRLAVAMLMIAVGTAACTNVATPDTSTSSTVSVAVTTTTNSPATTVAEVATTATTAPEASAPCLDLARDDGPESETSDVVLAAWNPSSGGLLWEIELGTRMPAWSVAGDQIVLAFPNGDLVSMDAATCGGWVEPTGRRLSSVDVIDGGPYFVSGDTRVTAYSASGARMWQEGVPTGTLRFALEDGGVTVLASNTGELLGRTTVAGELVFTWDGRGIPVAVAAANGRIFRSDGIDVSARPIAGGSLEWATQLEDVTDLFTLLGTLLGVANGVLHAIEPSTGSVVWSWTIPTGDPIVGEPVLHHQEIHIVTGTDSVWHLALADGNLIFEGNAPSGTEWFAETDDGLVLQVGSDGTVIGVDFLERTQWSLVTGANGIDRHTQMETVPGGPIVTLTFSAERF